MSLPHDHGHVTPPHGHEHPPLALNKKITAKVYPLKVVVPDASFDGYDQELIEREGMQLIQQ